MSRRQLKKGIFTFLSERFCFRLSFGNFGILCVLRNLQSEKLEQKIQSKSEKEF